ncbi:3-deoxy-manno-octulosonate-8-phosphatase KdsC [Idiomarina xiamenensis]|uniref:3-deoxy-D-manno-octulosonate 8-phosphate phosphatase KdsC n=1 Tax=Idiomarina xiamenensis 10-D-4 TaxID=740709 RepID=K2KSI8_9GAMM|nr:3-deoxy-D-manno-octulosonate 8-phosphate phosphatase [Idiomarina xiamenensis 10-D-4]
MQHWQTSGDASISTWYGEVPRRVMQAAEQIKLLVCDVDGVFSDGQVYLGNDGEELKAFHTRDGFGVKALLNAGIEVAVITGRRSRIVENRMQALGVTHIVQGCDDKFPVYQQLQQQFGLQSQQVACIGDDIPDAPMIADCGLGVAVYDAHPWVQQQASYVTNIAGGRGAVREISDLILLAQGKLHDAQGASV